MDHKIFSEIYSEFITKKHFNNKLSSLVSIDNEDSISSGLLVYLVWFISIFLAFNSNLYEVLKINEYLTNINIYKISIYCIIGFIAILNILGAYSELYAYFMWMKFNRNLVANNFCEYTMQPPNFLIRIPLFWATLFWISLNIVFCQFFRIQEITDLYMILVPFLIIVFSLSMITAVTEKKNSSTNIDYLESTIYEHDNTKVILSTYQYVLYRQESNILMWFFQNSRAQKFSINTKDVSLLFYLFSSHVIEQIDKDLLSD